VLTVFLLLVPFFYHFNKLKNDQQHYEKLFILTLLIIELFQPFYSILVLKLPWQTAFPLNMCDFSRFFLASYLLSKQRVFMEIGFFWGISGCIIAFISPDIQSGVPSFEFFFFFFDHAIILVAIAFILGAHGYRPTAKCLLRSTLAGILFTWLLYIINLQIGQPANYWYLIDMPASAVAFRTILPRAPWHMLYYYPIAFIVFPMIYLPFFILKKNERSLACAVSD
jgi:hypothetical integral membrane protein (TIGR02206 family)